MIEAQHRPGYASRTRREIDPPTARFDLSVEIFPYRKELFVYFDYRIDLYDDVTVAELQWSFKHVLESVIANPSAPLESVPLLPESSTTNFLPLDIFTSSTVASNVPVAVTRPTTRRRASGTVW